MSPSVIVIFCLLPFFLEDETSLWCIYLRVLCVFFAPCYLFIFSVVECVLGFRVVSHLSYKTFVSLLDRRAFVASRTG